MKKKNSILIIDDQPTNIKSFSHILEHEYTIYATTNGRDGIKCAEQYLPDVILLDILMMDMDGYAVIKELKGSEKTKNIPVIFVTSLNSKEEEEKGLALGAADYIRKPFHAATVKLRVRNQIELIRLRRDLEDAVKAAQTANNAKSAFLANMSHEIRTPMNVIVGLTELLIEDDIPISDVKDCLKKINMAGDILLRLINDILDISKIESGKLTLTPTRYELAKLLNDIITLNIIRAGDKPITFKLNIDGALPGFLYGDDLRVKQVLNNLLSNAFKYTKEGTVTLNVCCVRERENDLRLSFSVRDTGIGIHKEDIENLFEDYNQVDTQANRHIEGTGLGLSITKGLTELMDGELSVESEYDKGSVFHVDLLQGFAGDECINEETLEALRNFSYEDSNRAARKIARFDLSGMNVMVVDDYPPNLDVAKWMFAKYKMNVDCVTSGKDAIARIKLGQPVYDAVFMDYMMPGMDGIEAVRQIRALDGEYAKTVIIIALTADVIAGNEQMFLENGFQAFLSKPINLSKLDSIIRQWFIKDHETPELVYTAPAVPSEGANIEIPGIDAEQGLYLFDGDTEMFRDFLRSYADNIPAELDKLRCVSKETLPAYAIDVHTVKGASAGIGANDLADYAKRLEKTAKAGDLSGVLAENEMFLKAGETLVSDIRVWLAKN